MSKVHVDIESTHWGWSGGGEQTSLSSLTVLMARLSWGPKELVLTLFKFAFFPLRYTYMIMIHFSGCRKQAAKMEKWPTVSTHCPLSFC